MLVKKTILKRLTSFIVMQTVLITHATDIIRGDSSNGRESFNQPIKAFISRIPGRIYVGANHTGAQALALACVVGGNTQFAPLAPKTVFGSDGKSGMENPLYDAAISYLAIMLGDDQNGFSDKTIERPIAVTQSDPTSLHMIDFISRNRIDMLSLVGVKDASGSATTQSIVNVASDNSFCIFAAVKDYAGSQFGQGNSGIALVVREQTTEKKEENQPSFVRLRQRDAQYGVPLTPDLTRAALLNNQSACLRIGSPNLDILDNAVNMHWNQDLACLVVGLTVHSTGGAQDGCQALAIGSFVIDSSDKNIQKFVFKEITLHSLFNSMTNNIVGAVGADVSVSIAQVLSLYASTVVNYLVVLGGVGTSAQTKRMVYALPVVKNPSNPAYNGMLASRHAFPVTFYHSGSPERVSNRGFIQPAVVPDDLYTANDQEVWVGHGPMLNGDITSIMAYGDAVYAVVSQADVNFTPGVFHSQALFDSFGRIKEWTPWARLGGNFYDHCFGACLDSSTGNITMLTGTTSDTINTVKRTTWSMGDSQGVAKLVGWFNSCFTADNGGIQHIVDVPFQTPGIDKISLMVATGLEHVALAQTGCVVSNVLVPFGGSSLAVNPKKYTSGSIDTPLDADTNAISIRGGVLSDVGPIVSSAITRYSNAGYLFVGGVGGLALLSNDHGLSWDASVGLGNNLTGLAAGTAFKKLGNYKNIRSLFVDHDGSYLYVVCDDRFDRINISQSNFVSGDIASFTLAKTGQPPLGSDTVICDALASRSLGILGTSDGLFINGPYTDVRTAQSSEQVKWQLYSLPEGLSTAQKFFTVTLEPFSSSLTSSSGGNIYLLDTDRSKNRAVVHRMTVNTASTVPGVPYDLQMFPDLFIKDQGSYYVSFDGFRRWIYVSGGLFFQEADQFLDNPPVFALLDPKVRSGYRFGGISQNAIPLNLSSAGTIEPIILSSASGSWLLPQNNTLSVNE